MTHPLFGALSNPRVDVLQSLQKVHLDDLASLDPDGFTLLHAAAHFGRQDAVQYLVTDGFLPLVGDDEGNLLQKTPLHLAAESGSLATVQWLLREAQSRADELTGDPIPHFTAQPTLAICRSSDGWWIQT
jgi:ankyrin repeat protein